MTIRLLTDWTYRRADNNGEVRIPAGSVVSVFGAGTEAGMIVAKVAEAMAAAVTWAPPSEVAIYDMVRSVVVGGTGAVGQVLTATFAGVATGAQWYRTSAAGVVTAIPAATNLSADGRSSTYTVQAADVGLGIGINCRATSLALDSVPLGAAAAPAAPIISAPTVTTAPAIIGSSGTVGVSVSYTPGTYGGSASTVVRQYTLDGVNTGGSAAAGTPYTTAATGQLRVVETATNSAGFVVSTSAPITISAAAADTRPGWFAAPSSAATTGTAGFVSGRTILSGSASGGKAGTASPVATSGSNYAWFAIANAGAVTFHDNTANLNGGFVSAGTFTDANSTTWYLYKSDFPASYTSGTDSITIS